MVSRLVLLTGLLFPCLPSLISAADFTVLLDTGRRVRGEIVGTDSTGNVLTIKLERPGAMLVWHGNWERIRTVTVDGVEWTGHQFREQMRHNKTPTSIGQAPEQTRPSLPAPAAHDLPQSLRTPVELQGIVAAEPLDGPQPPPIFDPSIVPCCDDGLWGRGVVVGLRDDPLSAYPDLEAKQFPYGVPLSERAFARDLFRNTKAIDVYGPPSFVGPVPLPALNSRTFTPPSVFLAPGRSNQFRMFDNGGDGHRSRLVPFATHPALQPNPFLDLTAP